MEFRGPTDLNSRVQAIALGLGVHCPSHSVLTLYIWRPKRIGYPFDDTTPMPEQIERLRIIGYEPVPVSSESNRA